MTQNEADPSAEATADDSRLRTFLGHGFDVIALVGPDATVEYVSPAIQRVLGYTPKEFMGGNGFDHIHADDVHQVRRHFEELLQQPGASIPIDCRLRHKDGTWRWVESYVTNLLEDPETRAILFVFHDVTERKIAEAEARRRQEELTDFVENAPVPLHWAGPDGTILWANQAELNLLGYDRDEYIGRNIAEFHADPAAIADILRRLTRDEEVDSCEARLCCKDGSIRHVVINCNVYRRNGEFIHTRCFTRDITERRRLEAEVLKQREYWRVALSSIGDAVMLTDGDGRIAFMNPIAEAVCGVGNEVAAGKPLADVFRIVNERTREPVMSPVEKVLRTGHIIGLANHTVLLPADGREIPIDDSAAPIKDEHGNILGIVLVFRDVAEKRQAEVVSERLAAIVESSDDIIASKTLDGILTSWNKGAERILGYTADEIIGKHVSVLMPPEAIEDTEKILGRIRRGVKVEHYETKRRRKDGTIIDVSLTVSPVRNAEGEIIGASKIGRDITERKRIEAERLEAERRKDEFLAMLAHELRNPLASINSAVQLFGRLESEEELLWAKDVVSRQVKHLARLIDDLLDVSRITRGKITLKREAVNLSPIVNSAVEAVQSLIDERKHELTVSIVGTPRIEADPIRLEQILVNLLANATKYTDAGGQIALTARQEGADIVLAIRDTGIGIPSDLLPKVFDLFVQGDRTAARSEGGLGIGLTLVKSLVEMHGGSVSAMSGGPGTGSEFIVRLPALQKDQKTRTPTASLPRVAGQASRVLVVDDNTDTALGLSKLLKLLGHDVQTAFNGPTAIELARTYKPEVILLDIGLPGMDGYAVVRRLRKEDACKNALIVAVSGYGREEDRRRSREAGFDQHLVKPVDYDALLSVLAQPG
jgi:PAS domain S-box-containing protein